MCLEEFIYLCILLHLLWVIQNAPGLQVVFTTSLTTIVQLSVLVLSHCSIIRSDIHIVLKYEHCDIQFFNTPASCRSLIIAL